MNLILIVGGTGQGKSYFTNTKLLFNEVRKVNGKDRYFISPKSRRQYIFDLNNEYELPGDNITAPFMRHIACDEKFFTAKCKTLMNSNIVFEDASGFLRGRQSAPMARLIVQRRHSNNNYIILFHSINRIPPELLEYANYLVLFKTGDNLKDIDNKFKNPLINSMFLTLQKAKNNTHILKRLL